MAEDRETAGRHPGQACFTETEYTRKVGYGMVEQRKYVRVPVKLDLEVSEIFKQDNVRVSNLNAPIEVIDISRNGLGFITKSILPIGFYFNARLEFSDETKAINCVVRIIRQKEDADGTNHYGCEFVGMPTVFDYIFEELEEDAK